MPSLKISKESSLSAQDSFARISNLLENDQDLRKLDSKLQCQFDPQAMTGKADGTHFKAQMKVVSVGPGSHIEISVDLPFHLALVKGMVEKTLSQKLDKVLS
jgi:hypothetical protein